MVRTLVNEKARLESLIERLDSLESFFSNRENQRRMTAELSKGTLKLVARTRDAIKARRFEAVLLYQELEDLHRSLAAELDLIPSFEASKFQARYVEGRWNAARAPRQKLIDRRERCLNDIAALKNSSPNLTEAVINSQMAKKYEVTTHTIRNYRRSKPEN